MSKKILVLSVLITTLTAILNLNSSAANTNDCANKARLYMFNAERSTGNIQWIYLDCATDRSQHVLAKGTSQLRNGGGTLTIDPALGNIYATDWSGALNRIALNGAGGEVISLAGVSLNNPWGIAMDTTNHRFYIANYGNGKLLTGTLSEKVVSEISLPSHGLSALDKISDVKFDSQANRIYASNDGTGSAGSQINWLSTKTNTGGVVNITQGTAPNANTIAISKSQSKIYWTNYRYAGQGNIALSGVNLSGGISPINVTQPSSNSSLPQSLAIDESLNNLYWTAGRDLFVSTGSTTNLVLNGSGDLYGLALLKVPSNTTKPKITKFMSDKIYRVQCSAGKWENNRPWASSYNAPEARVMKILRNGNVVATNKLSYTTRSRGVYMCQETATNSAGSTIVSSNSLAIR